SRPRRPAATRAYRWPAWGRIEAARRPERERTRAFALSAIGSASSLWMRLSSFGNRSETRRRDRTSWAIPSTRMPAPSAIAGPLRRRRSVLDGAVGSGLYRPLPLAIGGRVDRERIDVALSLDQSAVGGLAGFADLQREIDGVVAVEQGEQGGDLLGGDMAGGGEGAGALPGDAHRHLLRLRPYRRRQIGRAHV